MRSLFMKFGFSFSDQINRGLSEVNTLSKAKVEESSSWQEGLSSLALLSKKEVAVSPWRLVVLFCFFLLTTLLMFGKIFSLQVIFGKENLFLSESNRILVERNLSERGLICDRNGEVLAKNTPGFRVAVNYSQLPEGKEGEFVLKLADMLQISPEEIRAKFAEAKLSRFAITTLKSGISHEAELKLIAQQEDFPGIAVAKDSLRDYPKGEIFAHVLGYLGAISQAELKDPNFTYYVSGDFLGREGLEKVYEEVLRGAVGQKLIEVDVSGGLKRVITEAETVPGNNLYLSLDAYLQEKAAETLASGVKKYAATGGVFIAEEVKSGQILAFVVNPSFDNNLFSGGIKSSDYESLLGNPQRPLFNRALSGTYPPGSTVKPLVAAAALQEKVVTPSTRIDDYPQVIKISAKGGFGGESASGGWEFPDWTVAWGRAAHGIMTVREAIAESCDIFFYKIGGGYHDTCYTANTKCPIDGLGVEKLKTYFNLFGLGQKTGTDLPGEVKGLVPDPIWKQEVKSEDWFLGNTYHISIGQGDLLTTPIQILQSINTIANGGQLLKPRFVEKIENVEGEVLESFEPEIIRKDFINKDYLSVIAEGMRMAVSEGIVYPLRNAKVPVAAKTGTAEFGTRNAKGEYETHAWVTGFAPYDDPEISFLLLLESGGASSNAAEVAREILDWYFER